MGLAQRIPKIWQKINELIISISKKTDKEDGFGATNPRINRGNKNIFQRCSFEEVNIDAGDIGTPEGYGTVFNLGQVSNAYNFKGWANQLFFGTSHMYRRNNSHQKGDFEGSPWGMIFDTLNCPVALSGRGWIKFANGLIIQYGYDSGKGGRFGQYLNIPFSNNGYIVVPTMANADNLVVTLGVVDANKSSTYFELRADRDAGDLNIHWVAFGY